MDTKERKKLHRWEQKNRWMAHYELKYGVLPIEYGPSMSIGAAASGGVAAYSLDSSPTVLKAKCRFCECFGREALSNAADIASGKAAAAAAAAAAGIEFPGSPMGSSGDGSNGIEEGSDHHGQPSAKRRKKRQTLKIFGPNFRTDNLESHLTREHPAKWKEYERLRDSEKKMFFPDSPIEQPSAKELLMAHHAAANTAGAMALPPRVANAPSNGGLGKMAVYSTSGAKQVVSTEIMAMVEQLLASPVLRQQQATLNLDSAAQATALWQAFLREDEQIDESTVGVGLDDASDDPATGGSYVTGDYRAMAGNVCIVSIKNEAVFQYIVDTLSARVPLGTTVSLVHAAQRLVPDAAILLSGVSLADVSAAVHQLVGLNLASISHVLSFAWGYSLFLRFFTHNGSGFVDVRVQVSVNDETHDLHVLALPLDAAKHSAEALGTAILRALTVLDARAMEKIVGVTIDGDPYHMQRYRSVGAWLKKQAEAATSQAGCAVLYSGVYHVSYIVDELLEHCQAEQQFLTSLAELEALCRGTASLRALMGPEPTRFASARWVAVLNACEWLTLHRETVLKWGADHASVVKLPSTQWWVTLFVLRDVLKDVYAVFHKCRSSVSCFADVQKRLHDLVFQLRLKFTIKPAAAASAGQLDPCEFTYQDFVNFVTPLDLFMFEAFQLKAVDGITDADRVALYERFHLVLMLLINKLLALTTSSPDSPVPAIASDPTVSSSTTEASSPHQYAMAVPPSTPYEFITIPNLAFMNLLNQQRFRISAKWTGKVLAMITEDRNRMMTEFAQPAGALYEAVHHGAKLHQSGNADFREAWKPFAVEFASLANFASVFGGLLTVTRTTDDEQAHYFYSMQQYAGGSNLALEAQLHASQFHRLAVLRRHGDGAIV